MGTLVILNVLVPTRKSLNESKIGLGGSCHWCTEAIFRSVKGVKKVSQGWISASSPHGAFSEAILFAYEPRLIALNQLVAIHLHSHSCTNAHRMRSKYRSAIYVFNTEQESEVLHAIEKLQSEFDKEILTQVLYFEDFKLNDEEYLDYYYRNPEKPFCKNHIEPKLRNLMERYDVFESPQKTY